MLEARFDARVEHLPVGQERPRGLRFRSTTSRAARAGGADGLALQHSPKPQRGRLVTNDRQAA